MPYVDGLAVIQMIREKWDYMLSGCLSSFCTFLRQSIHKGKMQGTGVRFQMVKPISADVLYDMIHSIFIYDDIKDPQNKLAKEKKDIPLICYLRILLY